MEGCRRRGRANPGVQAGPPRDSRRNSTARAAYLPTVSYSESLQWGNNPVYVFGALLEQHRFSSGNFEIPGLNLPDPLTNFASQLTAEQLVFDGHKTRQRLRASRVALDTVKQQKRQSEMDVLEAVMETYYLAAGADALFGKWHSDPGGRNFPGYDRRGYRRG